MARPKVRVQHFLACRGVEVDGPAGLDNPYTLRNVRYRHFVTADTEFPTTYDGLWVFCRTVNLDGGTGRVEFSVEVVWVDAPGGEEQTSFYTGLATYFPPNEPVQSRGWRLSFVRVPGPGGYELRLRRGIKKRVLATEYIRIERYP